MRDELYPNWGFFGHGQPTCKVVARRRGYVLYENGELWTTGSSPYLAGVADGKRTEELKRLMGF